MSNNNTDTAFIYIHKVTDVFTPKLYLSVHFEGGGDLHKSMDYSITRDME